jgi:uncharacterized protein
MGAPALRLRVLDGEYAVCRLSPSVEGVVVPPAGTGFWSLTEVGEERSLVCLSDLVGDDAGVVTRDWRILEVAGPLDLGLTGVMASIAVPLADAGVPIFPIATHDTDWVLVPGARLEDAVGALRCYGHEVLDHPR